MGLSAIGVAALEAREGNRRRAYRDTVGVWTIACGITTASGLIKVTPGLVLTAAECEALNARAFARYASYVDKALHGTWVEQNVYDALVSFCYNIGPTRFATSSCLRHVKAGNISAAQAAMLLWSKPSAVITRRQGEADQLVTPYAKRLPSARRGEAPVHVATLTKPVDAASTVPALPARKPVPITPAPVRPPSHLPAWWLAVGRFIDVMFGARLPAH